MQAIMNDTLKMDRRSKTRAGRRINGKLSQLLQERDDYLSGKKLRQFEASLVCKKAPKMCRKPGDDWTPDAERYCKKPEQAREDRKEGRRFDGRRREGGTT